MLWRRRQPRNHRDYVGPQGRYEATGKDFFALLLRHGLREEHSFLDIGCGSLRLGRLLIPFLLPGRYHGLEPGEVWVRAGLRQEVVARFGPALVEHKQPIFVHDDRFDLARCGARFDFLAAFAVFIHCGRAQLQACLEGARGVMGPDSVLFLDLNLAARSQERGRHAKYPWASHQAVVYSADDAGGVLTAAGYAFEIVRQEHSRRRRKTRALFKLRLRPDRG